MFAFYDDELHNLILVADKNIKEIIAYTAIYDYHPPLQYLLNKIFLQLFGLNEFWLAMPSIVFILLAIIIISRLVFQITNSVKLSFLCGVITAINPLILLWGSSIRWYPLWTFLIILSFYLFIKLWNNKEKNISLTSILIITLTLALYTNYQTILFLTAGVLTAFTTGIKNRNFRNLKQTLVVLLGVFILFIPYLSVFIFHLQSFFIRREIYQGFTGASPLAAGGYYLFTIFFGNSIYPWQTLFIIFFIAGFIGLFISLITFYNIRIKNKVPCEARWLFTNQNKNSKINFELLRTLNYFIIYLAALYFLQSVISGTISNRGLIFLPMLLTAAGSSLLYHLHKSFDNKSKIKGMRYGFTIASLSLLIIWFVGSYNVVTRQHLHKSGLAIPVKEVISVIETYENESESELSVVTTDFVLTYYLLKNTELKVISPYTLDLLKLFEGKSFANIDAQDRIIFIKSYPGSLMPLKSELDNYTDYLFSAGVPVAGPINLGYDPDFEMKIKFFPLSGIEEWRYKIYILEPNGYWDVEYLEKIISFKVY